MITLNIQSRALLYWEHFNQYQTAETAATFYTGDQLTAESWQQSHELLWLLLWAPQTAASALLVGSWRLHESPWHAGTMGGRSWGDVISSIFIFSWELRMMRNEKMQHSTIIINKRVKQSMEQIHSPDMYFYLIVNLFKVYVHEKQHRY